MFEQMFVGRVKWRKRRRRKIASLQLFSDKAFTASSSFDCNLSSGTIKEEKTQIE